MIICVLAAALVLAQPQSPKALRFEGIHLVHRKVATRSADAQGFFDQGLTFLYAFNHDEAFRSFSEAARLDPAMAMAHWGMATALGPHINNPAVEPEHARTAWAACQRALRGVLTESQTNQGLIRAAAVRFSSKPDAPRPKLDRAYAEAMRLVWRAHPRDADIGALCAEAWMDLRPWNLWKPSGAPQPDTLEIERTLERVLEIEPNHALALHLYIHVEEASPHPEKAVKAGDALRRNVHGLGHLVHMPSHVDVRMGRWADAILANEAAIVADSNYVKQVPDQGFYLVYMGHNHQMLSFAAMMLGRSKEAIDGMDAFVASIPEDLRSGMAPVLDGYLAAIYEVRLRFGRWDDLLAMPEPTPEFPIMRAVRHMARAVSYAVKGDALGARAEQSAFYAARAKVPADAMVGNNSANAIFAVAHHLMNGEIRLGAGNLVGSVQELKLAVRAEDAIAYNEPPDWLQPTRHALGAVLIRLKRYGEAEAVYREDLRRLPGNGWSTYGLAAALSGLGRTADAVRTKARFDKIWASADMKIGSSCLCVPGG